MSGVVVAFSGAIKSGKSSLARAVAITLSCPCVSFGDQVRSEVRARGLAESREILQQVGESLVSQHLTEFCEDTLAQARSWAPPQPLVIEGIRHAEALSELRMLVNPVRLFHVHIMLGQPTRSARAAKSGGTLSNRWDAHSTERQVHTDLPRIADLVVDGELATNVQVDRIVAWLSQNS